MVIMIMLAFLGQ